MPIMRDDCLDGSSTAGAPPGATLVEFRAMKTDFGNAVDIITDLLRQTERLRAQLDDARRWRNIWKETAKVEWRIVGTRSVAIQQAHEQEQLIAKQRNTLRAILGRVLSDFTALALTAPWAENARLRNERDEARDALREYGQHKLDCMYVVETCSCGFREVLK